MAKQFAGTSSLITCQPNQQLTDNRITQNQAEQKS